MVRLLGTNRWRTLGSRNCRYSYISPKQVQGSLFCQADFFKILKHKPKVLNYLTNCSFSGIKTGKCINNWYFNPFKCWVHWYAEWACIPQKAEMQFILSPLWLMFRDTDTLLVLVKPKTRDIIIARKSYELMNISARPTLPLSSVFSSP